MWNPFIYFKRNSTKQLNKPEGSPVVRSNIKNSLICCCFLRSSMDHNVFYDRRRNIYTQAVFHEDCEWEELDVWDSRYVEAERRLILARREAVGEVALNRSIPQVHATFTRPTVVEEEFKPNPIKAKNVPNKVLAKNIKTFRKPTPPEPQAPSTSTVPPSDMSDENLIIDFPMENYCLTDVLFEELDDSTAATANNSEEEPDLTAELEALDKL